MYLIRHIIEPPRRVDDGDSQTRKIIVCFLGIFTASLPQRFLILHLRY